MESIANRVGGPITAANVVAELQGSEKPMSLWCWVHIWIPGNWGRALWITAATRVDATTALAAPLKQFDATTLTTDADWGTDNFDYLLQGVPTFVANQEEYNYLLNYHAVSDTFDKVDLAQLKKHVAKAAALTFGIANAAARPHHAEIEQTLRETHLDEQLKTFGMWNAWENGKWGRKD